MAKPLKVWSGTEWISVSSFTSGGGGGDLTSAAAASVYFPISSSVTNFGTIKTLPATENVVADLITDELTFAAENGVILNATASVDQLTISTNATWNNTASAIVMRDGSGTFSIGAVDFDTTASPALSVGRIQWNQEFGTPEVGLIGGNVTANIGQHVHAFVTNDEASSLVKGDVVYLFGAAGNRASVKKAYNLSDTTSSKTLGVVAETIAAGQTGFVTVFGVVSNLDLSAYSPGDVLWLSASPGKFTTIKPSAPQHLVFVGVVEKANSGNGQLFVNVQNGYELEELHSVSINSLTDNDILSYNGSSSLWFNQNLAAAIQEVDGTGSGIDADLLDGQHGSYYAPLDSPAFTGTPTAPTASAATNTTQIATTAFVRTEISNLVDTAPSTLDTLNELAAAINDDANFATTITNSIAGKVSKSGGDTITSTGSVIPLTIQSASGQSQFLDLFKISDVSSNTKFSIGNNGYLSSYGVGALLEANINNNFGRIDLGDTGLYLNVYDATNGVYSSGSIAIEPELVAIEASGSSSTSGVVAYWESTGLSVSPNGPGVVPFTIYGANGQQSSLQMWKTYNDQIVASISPDGILLAKAIEVSSSAVVTNFNADLLDGLDSTYFQSAATASATFAPLNSPTFTGTPLAPTAMVDTNTTQIATTQYVIGQGYLKSETASSLYISQASPKTGTASIVYSMNPTLIRPILQSPQEKTTISSTAATASINYDVLSQTVLYYTSSAIGNWHLNIIGDGSNTLSSLLNVGESITLVFGVTQGATAYYQLNTMIDGTSISPKWQGGSAPTGGNISGVDIYSFTVIKTDTTPTYTVLGSLTGFA